MRGRRHFFVLPGILVLLVVASSFSGCNGGPGLVVADPKFSPEGKTFDNSLDVALSCETAAATIRYTLDGSDPTEGSAAYANPLHLIATTTVKARAFVPGSPPSNVTSATFTLNESDWAADSFTFDVTWSPETTVIDPSHLALVKSSDQTAKTYTFDAAGAAAAGLNLSVGRILAIYGDGLAKITSVQTSGADLVVGVEPAELTDAITDGTIAWDYGVSFTPDRVQKAGTTGQANKRIAKESELEMSFKDGPFDYNLKVKLLDTAAECEFTITKSVVGEVKATFTTKGNLGRFRSKDTILIKDRKIQNFGHSYEKLRGNATLSLVVAGSGNNLSYKHTVPLMKVPFVVGYIPVSLDIGAQFVVNAVVPLDATAQVVTDFTYDSDMGLTYNGTKVEANANVGGHEISTSGETPYAGGASQTAVSFGAGFPHIELSVGHKWLAEGACWFHPAFIIGGSFTTNNTLIPVCMKIESEYLVAGGYTLSVLNELLKPLDGSKTIFDDKQVLRQSGNCPAK